MNALHHLAALSLLGILTSTAQKVTQESDEDPVQKAIREFNRRDTSKPNEVTVRIAPTEDQESSTPKKEQPAADATKPVLVTGKPSSTLDSQPASDETAEAETPADEAGVESAALATAETTKPKTGLAVRVQKLQSARGTLSHNDVKLRAPFPAKPLASAPAGWQIESSDAAPPFSREVEISSGRTITLSVRPHVLVPDADGVNAFAIGEPGFEPSLGYEQATTISAILSQSVRQLETDSRELSSAIDSLQQILVSLPKPETPDEAKPNKPAK